MPFIKGHPQYSTYRFPKGNVPHNKGKKGYTNGGTFKEGHKPVLDQWGEKNVSWKGDSVGYSALHRWIRRRLGAPNQCESCGTTTAKRFEWANKSHEYKRELTDWFRLCSSCHYAYDRTTYKLVLEDQK